SKAQMFEGLIEFIEKTLFSLINKLTADEKSGLSGLGQAEGIVSLLLGFAKKNPGMTRVLIGDALVNENDRLQARINQLHDRLEATLKQALRFAASEKEVGSDVDIPAQANFLMCYVIGRWHQFAKSGFKRDPMEYWEAQRQELFSDEALKRVVAAAD
ncbi:MAG TPA: nucleoid occlusion factor SlmA, partial [Nitrosospira sp.]